MNENSPTAPPKNRRVQSPPSIGSVRMNSDASHISAQPPMSRTAVTASADIQCGTSSFTMGMLTPKNIVASSMHPLPMTMSRTDRPESGF